jgi:hypothetical protein
MILNGGDTFRSANKLWPTNLRGNPYPALTSGVDMPSLSPGQVVHAGHGAHCVRLFSAAEHTVEL